MKTLITTIENEIAIIKLNRPESLNSINESMHKELYQSLKEIKGSSARVLLLTGTGKGFCSGQDLSDRQILPEKKAMPDLGDSLDKYYNPLIKEMIQFPLPIVCAVNGVAAGAGVSLVLASDIILMAESASLVFAFSKIGLVPDSGCTWLLSQSVGWRRAKALCLLGEKMGSQQSLDWGIAWQVFPDLILQEEAMKLVERLRKMPTQGLSYIKRVFRNLSWHLEKQLEIERDFQRLAGRTLDYQEGVTAFLEKRKPEFKGR